MFPTPTTGYPPGSLMAVDSQGQVIPSDEITSVPIQTNRAEFPEFTSTEQHTINLGLLANILLKGTSLKLSLTNNFDKDLTVKIVVDDALEEGMLARPAEDALKTKTNVLRAGMLITRGYEIEFVLETIKARKVEWQFDREQLNQWKLDGVLGQLASLTPSTKWTNGVSAKLAFDYPDYRRVFYHPLRVGVVATTTPGEEFLAFKKDEDGGGEDEDYIGPKRYKNIVTFW